MPPVLLGVGLRDDVQADGDLLAFVHQPGGLGETAGGGEDQVFARGGQRSVLVERDFDGERIAFDGSFHMSFCWVMCGGESNGENL